MSRLEKYFTKTEPNKRNKAAIAYLASLDHIEESAPHVANTIVKELKSQRSHLKLIASENFSSLATQLAMGNLLTDKYAEGYVNHRFYAGCENVDLLEEAAEKELKSIFNADCAYVQPHSGADANLVAFWSIIAHRVQNKELIRLGKKSVDELTPEEYEAIRQLMVNQKVMGLSLNSGGHLTHGYRHNISSKMMKAVLYDVDPKTELLDYDLLAAQVLKEKPTILLAGYSAYSRKLNFAKMREIADSVGATLMVDMAHFSGLVAGKVFTGEFDPVPYADVVTSTTHKTLRGPRGGFILCKKEFEEIFNKGCPLVLGGPLPHVIAAKAIAFKEANTPEFQKYAAKIVENSQALATSFLKQDVRIVAGGTDNHLFVIDLTKFGLTGRQAETALRNAYLTVNRNAIPYDKNGPWYTSGIRLGTPAVTTLGMGVQEMQEIASIILDILSHTKPAIVQKTSELSRANAITEPEILEKARIRVMQLLNKFPLYPEIDEECLDF
jgi:glycine hydroxymethyltransferase